MLIPHVRHPARLDPGQLLEISRFFGEEVAAGKYPFIDYNAEDRWHQRIYRDPRMDIWLISWLPTQGTQLHDHGGSSGAFTVLSGTLTESVVAVGRSRTTVLDQARSAGDSVGFGPRYVHDVRNLGNDPAVSVHVYSAPLSSMTYYDVVDGTLAELVTVETDDPEFQLELAG